VEDFDLIGMQLQAKNRNFWDTYDRKTAEMDFRYSIVWPLAAIIIVIAGLSRSMVLRWRRDVLFYVEAHNGTRLYRPQYSIFAVICSILVRRDSRMPKMPWAD
jgi:hypothetical protein